MCSPQEQCVDYKCRPRGETLHCVLAKHNINNLFLAMDCTCGVEAVNRRNFYRMVGNEREKITQVYLTIYKSSMMRPTSNIPNNNNKHESEQPKTSKKNSLQKIIKPLLVLLSLTRPSWPLMSKCHCQFSYIMVSECLCMPAFSP